MRRVSFDFFQQRLDRVWRARRLVAGRLQHAGDGRPMPEDMLSLTMHAVETHGPNCTVLETADQWLDHLDCHWHEYGVALENLALGITPPTSGEFNNDYYGECTGGTSRAEFWGMIQPADPVAAADRAAADAHIGHSGAAVEIARFVAAAVAEGFSTVDMRACMRVGVNSLPASSQVASAATSILAVSDARREWQRLWAGIAAQWGHAEPTNAQLNFAGMLLALGAGDLDWARTYEIVQHTGGDIAWKAVLCATFLALMGSDVEMPGRTARVTQRVGKSVLRDIDSLTKGDDFVDRACQLAVACARPGEVELTGAPYVAAPGPHVAPPLRLQTRYEDEPVIAPGEEKAVFLERPTGAEDIVGGVEIEAPAEMSVVALGGVVVPGKIAARAIDATLVEAAGQPGQVKASIRRTGRTVAESRFGFRRASRYVAFGPFDNADGKGLERAYLNETSLDERMAGAKADFHKRVLRTAGDVVDVDGAFGAVGPRIIYLLRVVNSPSARAVALHVGCSDGIKLWLNGKRILADHTHRYATPRDYVLPCTLKKGANRITVKLARCGRTSVFRLRITERDTDQALTDLWDQFPE